MSCQAGPTNKVTDIKENGGIPEGGNFEIEDPFRRRDSIRRSPPRSKITEERLANRKNSFSSVVSTEQSEDEADGCNKTGYSITQANKRKREEAHTINIGRRAEVEAFNKILANTFSQINILAKIVKDYYNPKKELVVASKKMSRLAEQLHTYGGWLKSAAAVDDWDKPKGDGQNSNKEIQTCSTGTQVTETDLDRELEIGKQKEVSRLKDLLKNCKEWRELGDIWDKEWPEEVYDRTKMGGTDITLLSKQGGIVLIADPQKVKPDKMIGALEFKFPTLPELIRQNDGDVDFVLNKTKTVSKSGTETEEVRAVYFVPWVSSPDGSRDEEHLYQQLLKLNDTLKLHPTDKLTVVTNGQGTDFGRLRKLLECVFYNLDNQIVIASAGQDKGSKQMSTSKSEKMVIKGQGKTYAELLKDIKSNVDVDSLGVKIKNIRKTGKGDLMFEVEGQRREANILKEEIKKKVENASDIKIHSKVNLLHVNDIDPTMDNNEVLDAIRRAIVPSKKGLVEVRFLRKNAGGGQVAMVAIEDKESAEYLVKVGRIRIGWTNCRIKRWVRLERCFRCQQYGHRADQCKGEDRAGVCRKCGNNEHGERECSNKPFCLTCNIEGHYNYHSKCPVYRNLMKEKAQESKKLVRRPGVEKNKKENPPINKTQ